MRKVKRTYDKGRPITGWAYGRRVTAVEQVKPGDILIGDCHQFGATNLYRVVARPAGFTNLRRGDGKPGHSMFDVVYIEPNRRRADGLAMCVHHFELAPTSTRPGSVLRTSYYFAHQVKKPVLMS